MKFLLTLLGFIPMYLFAQQRTCENIFIVTTDGYRWQELFNGADSALLFDGSFVNDTTAMRYMYWANTVEERRKKLMPFTWNYINARGQLYGNRNYNNEASVENPYRLSYAGYNEIFTGFADPGIIANRQKNDPNSNVLSFLNKLQGYENSVAMFGSWKLFPYILNGTKNKIPLNAGYQFFEDDSSSEVSTMINDIQQASSYNTLPTRSDLLTYTLAMEYTKTKHPKIVYIAFGETDEFAHHGQYDKYLSQANQFDKFLSEIWSMIQEDEFYKNKTTLFLTTDHGRGRKPGKWIIHGPLVAGSDETWMMQLGPNIPALGEIKEKGKIRNVQFAQTIAGYLGATFLADHPVAKTPYSLMQKRK